MTYAYRLLPGGYVDETGVHRGVPPTPEDFARIGLLTLHRRLFAEGKIQFMPHLEYDALFSDDSDSTGTKPNLPDGS